MTDDNGMSVIVPFYNEQEGIDLFCKKIDEYAATMDFRIELIFVDDGSDDETATKLSEISFEHVFRSSLIVLSKNFGSHAAIRAGLTKASFPICTWMGCDLQEPFDILPISFSKITREGYDAIYIEKKSVDVSAINRLFSKIYSKMMCKYAVKSYSSGGISTIVFNQKIKDFLNKNIEANSSIMLQIMDAGFNYCNLSLDYGKRAFGKSKWTIKKKIKLFIDSFVAFSFMPIRVVSIIGVLIFLLGALIGFITLINRFVNPKVPMGYSTLTSIVAMGFGITNISLGIIAEYLWRTYDAARGREVFIISDTIQLKGKENE